MMVVVTVMIKYKEKRNEKEGYFMARQQVRLARSGGQPAKAGGRGGA